MPDPRAAVRLVAGDGLVGRRSDEIVFSPSADSRVVEAFLAAARGRGLDSVTALAESDPEVGGFVAVQWAGHVRVAVFGDVEVTSDHRGLPRLSASAAGTWVERSIDAPATVRCGAGPVLPATSLVEGVVAAGGFELELAQEAAATSGVSDPGPSARYRSHVAAFEALSESDEDADDEDEEDDQQATEATGPMTACPSCLSPVPAGSGTCPTCGHDTSRSPAAFRWQIVFDDGRVEPVDRTLVLGRQPAVDDAASRAVVVGCDLVSATHLEVRESGPGLHLTDLGSRNKTFVLTTGDAQFVPIEPGRAHRVDDGTVVQIGRQRFTVARVEGPEAG